MPDQIDMAQTREIAAREAAIVRARRPATTVPSSHCLDCARPIPAKRKAACPWAIRCVDCQELSERAA